MRSDSMAACESRRVITPAIMDDGVGQMEGQAEKTGKFFR